jgi:hypothetical protein
MFLRGIRRSKDGKEHRYFSVVENRRVSDGRVVQRQLLYLGEINDTQQAAWRKTLEVFDEAEQRYSTRSLFPDDREVPAEAIDSIQVKLSEMELRRPRAFGNCWLGCEVWRQLGLDQFWRERLGAGVERETVPWEKGLELLVVLCQEDAQASCCAKDEGSDPSKSPCRRRLQTAISCCESKARWW